MTPLQSGFFIVLLTLLTACAVNAPKIDSLQDSIAVGYLTVESVADSTAIAFDSGWIDADEKTRIKTDLQTAKHSIDQSRRLLTVDLSASQDALATAEAILATLQQLLQEHSP